MYLLLFFQIFSYFFNTILREIDIRELVSFLFNMWFRFLLYSSSTGDYKFSTVYFHLS